MRLPAACATCQRCRWRQLSSKTRQTATVAFYRGIEARCTAYSFGSSRGWFARSFKGEHVPLEPWFGTCRSTSARCSGLVHAPSIYSGPPNLLWLLRHTRPGLTTDAPT